MRTLLELERRQQGDRVGVLQIGQGKAEHGGDAGAVEELLSRDVARRQDEDGTTASLDRLDQTHPLSPFLDVVHAARRAERAFFAPKIRHADHAAPALDLALNPAAMCTRPECDTSNGGLASRKKAAGAVDMHADRDRELPGRASHR